MWELIDTLVPIEHSTPTCSQGTSSRRRDRRSRAATGSATVPSGRLRSRPRRRRRCSISSTLAVSAADISRARAALISLNRSGVAPSGQMQTTPSSRSGWATARCSARCPPHEWPATQACASPARPSPRARLPCAPRSRRGRRPCSAGCLAGCSAPSRTCRSAPGRARRCNPIWPRRRAVAAPARPCPRGRRPTPRRRWGSRSATRLARARPHQVGRLLADHERAHHRIHRRHAREDRSVRRC